MFRRVIIALFVLIAVLVGTAYSIGNPGIAYTTWAKYNLAVAQKDGTAAANLISANVIGLLDKHRRLALTASEDDLLNGSMIDLLGTVRLRVAAYNAQPIRSLLQERSAPRTFVANFYNHGPAWDTSPFAPALVIPLGPATSIAWMGSAQYPGIQTLLMSIAAGSRFTFIREDNHWRIDLSPLLRFPADEYDYYAGRTPGGRKQFLNNLFAHQKPHLQKAMWSPIRKWTQAQLN